MTHTYRITTTHTTSPGDAFANMTMLSHDQYSSSLYTYPYPIAEDKSMKPYYIVIAQILSPDNVSYKPVWFGVEVGISKEIATRKALSKYLAMNNRDDPDNLSISATELNKFDA